MQIIGVLGVSTVSSFLMSIYLLYKHNKLADLVIKQQELLEDHHRLLLPLE